LVKSQQDNIGNVSMLQITLNAKKLKEKVAVYFEVYFDISQMVQAANDTGNLSDSNLKNRKMTNMGIESQNSGSLESHLTTRPPIHLVSV